MDKTQPHFNCRKSMLKKCDILKKSELSEHTHTKSNNLNVCNLIFQKRQLRPTSAEAVRKTVTSQASPFLTPGLQKKLS